MKLKKFLLSFSILSFSLLSSQNSLSYLYSVKEGESFPKDMKKSKDFIDKIGNQYLIYGLMGDENDGLGHYQFEVQKIKDSKILIPYTDNFFLELYDVQSQKHIENMRFDIDYVFEFKKYMEFDLQQNPFSSKNYYELAVVYTRFDNYDLIKSICENILPKSEDKTKEFISIINKKNKTEIPYLKEKNNYFELAELLENEFASDGRFFSEILYDSFIKSEKDSQTFENIKKLFKNPKILDEISERYFVQTINIASQNGLNLIIPEKYLGHSKNLQVKNIQVKLDLINKKTTLKFQFKTPTEVIIKKGIYSTKDIKNKEVKNENISATSVQIIISESTAKPSIIVDNYTQKETFYSLQ